MKKITLISNITHFYNTAVALNRNNLLKTFISGFYINKEISVKIPNKIKNRISSRINTQIPEDKMHSLFILDILYKSLLRVKFIPRVKIIKIYNRLFDYFASKKLDENSDINHIVSSIAYNSLLKSKKYNKMSILEERAEHPTFLIEVLQSEYNKLNLNSYNVVNSVYWREQVLKEYPLADYILVSSNFVKKGFVDNGFSPDKLLVLPYGCDTNKFSPKIKNDNIFRIIYVGQINVRKGIHYLIEAFKEINLPNIELVLIGKLDESITNVINPETFSENNIIHIDYVENHKLVDYYSQSSVFILPSLSEAFGLVLLEAMACGIPVITTKNVGASELITDNVEGIIIEPFSSNAIKKSIINLYNDQEKLKIMGSMALKTAQNNTWENYEKNLMEIYNNFE